MARLSRVRVLTLRSVELSEATNVVLLTASRVRRRRLAARGGRIRYRLESIDILWINLCRSIPPGSETVSHIRRRRLLDAVDTVALLQLLCIGWMKVVGADAEKATLQQQSFSIVSVAQLSEKICLLTDVSHVELAL